VSELDVHLCHGAGSQRKSDDAPGYSPNPAALGPYLCSEEVARRLHISIRTLYELTRTGQIPHRRLPGSRRCLFRLDELEAWEDGAELEVIDSPGRRVVRPRAHPKAYSLRTREQNIPAKTGLRNGAGGCESPLDEGWRRRNE
jgi:excisionase family DNA binding protein